jgi:DNA-directed RNA polymerase II subunit RPB7
MGFFAEAGPLAVFVSNHLIPEEFEFDTGGEPCYASAADGRRLAPGAEVRLRVVGTRVDAREIFAVGTVKDDYLGLLEARAGA